MALRLLHYSDLENAYDDPERVGRLAGLVRSLRGDDALVCGTGDNTSPGVLALVTRGEQALDFFEAARPDVATFGNHDFDYGPERTLELVERSPQQWLAANVHEAPHASERSSGERDATGGSASSDPRDVDGQPFGASVGVRPHAVLEADGERVGFFGVTDPRTDSINPYATDLTFTDPVAAAREATAALRERGADYVVALSHLGRGEEELAAEVDVDAVLGGHVHSERVERIHGTVLARPGANGEVLLEVTLPDREVTRHEVTDGPLDPDVARSLRERMDAAGLGEVVAQVADPIERSERTAFRGESRVGNFVADAYRWATGADVGLQNSGGIRSGPPLAGEVTVADLVSIVPFEEPVVVAELSGAELREVFEQAGGAGLNFGKPEWWHAHVSGARLVYDFETHELVEAIVGDDPLRDDATYTLATSEYLLYTADEFPTLSTAHRVATYDTQYEVLAARARAEGIDPEIEGRIVRAGS